MSDVNFYSDLPALRLPVKEVFKEAYFSEVPAGWHVIVSDVKASTAAISEGRHNDVNLVAVGGLVAALNTAKKSGIDIPFFFGGDGSTLLVPQKIAADVLAGLAAHSANAEKSFGLQMHIGSLPVSAVKAAGHFIKIAKLEIDSLFNKAITIGNGLQFAEQQIKEALQEKEPAVADEELNLTGLECRWDRIKPPADEAESVCYLIEAAGNNNQLEVYTAIFKTIEEIYGNEQMRSPLSPERLKLLFNLRKIGSEMMVKFGRWRFAYFIDAFFRTILGRLYFKYNWKFGGFSGRDYLTQLIAHADTLTVDGRINTIICSNRTKHNLFLDYLTQQEKQGNLIYGHHVSKESIMTCYIENRNAKHIHFVDGADGGYTEAAKEFKMKLKQQSDEAHK